MIVPRTQHLIVLFPEDMHTAQRRDGRVPRPSVMTALSDESAWIAAISVLTFAKSVYDLAYIALGVLVATCQKPATTDRSHQFRAEREHRNQNST
jgi:hypothetical protein